MESLDKRLAGVLLPVSSLPGTLGIGDFGDSAHEFLDILHTNKVGLWQILPLNPVGYGNSPYQPYSAFAGDLIYVSVESVYRDLGLSYDFEPVISDSIDYDKVREVKEKALRYAYSYFKPSNKYEQFCQEAFWLEEFAEFMAIRRNNPNMAWIDWPNTEFKLEDKEFEKFVQYYFYTQWMTLKEKANNHNIEIVGDIPIYVGHDSAEVYYNREDFLLDDDGRPIFVAGVPPDDFSDDGQLWGNPLYDWDKMKQNSYDFWVKRMAWNQKLFDVIRIDHFRAFDTYWKIPAGDKTAKNGEWILGPAHDFFNAMYEQLPNLKIVVEDLGDLRPEVLQLRDDFNLMGMRIIQFALKPHEFLDCETISEDMIVYPGTHDNQTLLGNLQDLDENRIEQIRNDLQNRGFINDDIVKAINLYTLSLKARWAILPIQDILGMDDKARINSPGTVGSPNWEWKLINFNEVYPAMSIMKKDIELTQRIP